MFLIQNRLLSLPKEYYEAIKIGSPVFPQLFEFENGLRLAIHKYMIVCYGSDWWENSLKHKLRIVYDYVENQKNKNSFMPWIGDSDRTILLPLHSVTLGQLEEIVSKYKSDCIPELFPTMEFFKGHMEIIKRVRNMFTHMYPCLTSDDIKDAISEMKILCKHIKKKI